MNRTQLTFADLALPRNIPLYVTVRSTNKAGLVTETNSVKFIIDDTPPEIITKASFDLSKGTISTYDGYQWDPSVISVKWEFRDIESSIKSHFVTFKISS